MKNNSGKISQSEYPAWATMSDDELLSQMEMLFNVGRGTLESLQIELFEDARDRTTTEWFDADVGLNVQPWLLIPYRKTIDQKELRTSLETAKTLVPILGEHFANRELTAQFLHAWGVFNHAVGFIDAIYHSEGEDLGLAFDRSGESTKKFHHSDGRRKWFATVIIGIVDQRRITRSDAEDKFISYTQDVIECGEFPPGTDVKWWKSFLSKKKCNIITTFDEHHFSLTSMRKFIAESDIDIPPIPDQLT